MLHTLMKSPFEINFFSLIRMIKTSDDFLALQDGVLISVVGNIFLKRITFATSKLYVIQEDVDARGLHNKISNQFILISYIDFVNLTIKNRQQMSW